MRPRNKKSEVGELSQAVKRLRDALDQTQQQFAQTLNTAITTVARYETGRAPRGLFLTRLADLASNNNLPELANVFRGALTRELGSWDSTGFTLDLEPKDDTERLYVAAVLAVLRNKEYTRVIPVLNKALSEAAQTSIDKLDWIQRNFKAREEAKKMARAGSTPEQIASKVGVPVEEVRQFLNWARLQDLIASQVPARGTRNH